MIVVQASTRKCLILALVFLIAILSGVVADAATYYVAKAGNDATSCAQAEAITTPKRTISSALACLTAAGDTLFIRGGTYAEGIYHADIGATGTPNNRITIAAHNGETVILAPTSTWAPSVDRFVVRLANTKQYLTFEGLIFDGGSLTGLGNGSNVVWTSNQQVAGLRFNNVTVRNGRGNGVLARGEGFAFTNSIVHSNGSGTDYGNSNGMYLEGITNSLIQNVLIYDNECFGLRIFTSGLLSEGYTQGNNNIVDRVRSHTNGTGKGLAGAAACASAGGGFVIGDVGNTVRNSIAYNNHQYGFWTFQSANGTSGTKFYNNTAYNNTYGIVAASGTMNSTFINNLSAGNSASNYSDGAAGTVSITNRFTGSITDCTVSTSDFRLRDGAICIDSGTTIATVLNDIAGVSRPQGGTHDIGAHESTGSDSPPQSPQALRVK